MRKYCLTYDAMDSGEWDSNELKKAILEILIQGGVSITDFETPTASTVLFQDNDDALLNRIRYWQEVLEGEFIAINENGKLKTGIFYYLCRVSQTKKGTDIQAMYDDPSLTKSLIERLKEIMET